MDNLIFTVYKRKRDDESYKEEVGETWSSDGVITIMECAKSMLQENEYLQVSTR